MKCPQCNKKVIIDKGFMHAECYGSGRSVFQCTHCETKFSLHFERKVSTSDVCIESPDKETSW